MRKPRVNVKWSLGGTCPKESAAYQAILMQQIEASGGGSSVSCTYSVDREVERDL